MADIKIEVKNGRMIFREMTEINGVALAIQLSNKNTLRSAIQSLQKDDDEVIVQGAFRRILDFTAGPIAVFTDAAHADAFLDIVGANYMVIENAGTIDGFDFLVVNRI